MISIEFPRTTLDWAAEANSRGDKDTVLKLLVQLDQEMFIEKSYKGGYDAVLRELVKLRRENASLWKRLDPPTPSYGVSNIV